MRTDPARNDNKRQIVLIACALFVCITIVVLMILASREGIPPTGGITQPDPSAITNIKQNISTPTTTAQKQAKPPPPVFTPQPYAALHEGTLIRVGGSTPFASSATVCKRISEVAADFTLTLPQGKELCLEENTAYHFRRMVLAYYSAFSISKTSPSASQSLFLDQARKWDGSDAPTSEWASGLQFHLRYKNEAHLGDRAENWNWFRTHAAEYGFVIDCRINASNDAPYAIFRYVGFPHARYIAEKVANNYQSTPPDSLDDLLFGVNGYLTKLKGSYRNPSELNQMLPIDLASGASYRIYYVDSIDSILLPTDSNVYKSYEVSGDNQGGYIVTLEMR